MQFRAHRVTESFCRQIDANTVVATSADGDAVNVVPGASSHTFPVPFRSPLASFSEGLPFAYLLATVITGVGLLISAFTYVSQPEPLVVQSKRSATPRPAVTETSESVMVGRITGMVDCVWSVGSEDKLPLPACGRGTGREGALNKTIALHSTIRLGDQFNISSGLLEITYDTGAKVILQGPVKYEVESKNGGFISVGKLTGKVTSEAARGLTIRTPTAVVTDLGTEFGVEVSKEGNTTSRVFRGSIRLQVVSHNGTAKDAVQVLNENESARVKRSGDRIIVQRIKIPDPSATPIDFVREMRRQAIRTLDLVDVVAGGDGFSGRRNAGIDPVNGRITTTTPKIGKEAKDFPLGDRTYHRVKSLPLVDGVLIPDGSAGPVQIDSAGHTFDDFGPTDNHTAGPIWAGGVLPAGERTALGGVDYAAPGHRVLGMHANKGITFDLQAIRRANPDQQLVRFRAIVGNTELISQSGQSVFTDVCILVDGQVRFRRREINNYSGAMPVNIRIGKNDRFLTLVATDGGDTIAHDWIIFGDPRLELAPAEVNSESLPKQTQ